MKINVMVFMYALLQVYVSEENKVNHNKNTF